MLFVYFIIFISAEYLSAGNRILTRNNSTISGSDYHSLANRLHHTVDNSVNNHIRYFVFLYKVYAHCLDKPHLLNFNFLSKNQMLFMVIWLLYSVCYARFYLFII